jgi:hypothetical protein
MTPQCKTYEDVLQNIVVILEDEGFTTHILEDLREVHHAQYQEPSDITKQETYEEGCQPLEGEQELSHDSPKEDLIEEHDDEILMCTLTSDEVIQAFVTPAEEEDNMVSPFPFQCFDDALFYEFESKEVLKEPLDVLKPSCYDKHNDMVDNIDEFIHVVKRKWDVIGYDGDPINDIEGHFHLFPSQISYEIDIDSNIWQQGDDMFVTPISLTCLGLWETSRLCDNIFGTVVGEH